MTKTKSSHGPFSFIYPSIREVSLFYILVAFLFCVLLWLTQSYKSLILVAVASAASILSELIDNKLTKKNTLYDGTAFVEGLMVGLLLPASYSPFSAFIIITLTLYITKHLFGGLASSWANPIVVTIAVLYALDISHFPPFLVDSTIAKTEDLGSYLFTDGAIKYLDFDLQITTFFNNIFSSLGIRLPEGYITLFCDSQSPIPAFRFNILTICVSLFVISEKIVSWIIPFVSIGVYAILVRLFSLTPFTGLVGHGNMLVAILTGGTLFFVFFMLTWYGTTPNSFLGQFVYALVAGGLLFVFNGYGTSSIGSVFAVLAVNVISPCIQLIERKIYGIIFRKRMESVVNA